MNIDEKKAENTPAGGVLIGKKDGQTIIHDEGTMSGYLVGKLHKDGGIKAVNKATGQPLEMQGGEVVITAPAVADQTKREFEGKMMTNREILSTINEKGGGVSFADGGDIPAKIHTTDCEYKLGGKVVKDTDIAHSLGMNSTLKKGKQQFSSGDSTYDVDAIYNAIKKGKLRLKTKEVETFPMKYSVYDKNYAENNKIDFRKPNGITVRTESGEEVLIDGNHRMNNAYLNGRKTMKTYYIEDPKQIAKFTKKNKFMIGGYNAKTISDFENPKEAIEYVDKEIVGKAVGIYTGGKFKEGGHLSKGKSLKKIAEMHNVSLAHINEELAKGLEVEKEHFSDFKERTRVAKDHLVENPNYYTILEKAGLKNGGHIQNQKLVRKSKKEDTSARDLDEYNDVLDVQADEIVGGDSGLAFAKGGITPIDANIEGDSVDILANGSALGLDPKKVQQANALLSNLGMKPINKFGKNEDEVGMVYILRTNETYQSVKTPDGVTVEILVLNPNPTIIKSQLVQQTFIKNWNGKDWFMSTLKDKKGINTNVYSGKILNDVEFKLDESTPEYLLFSDTLNLTEESFRNQIVVANAKIKEIIKNGLNLKNESITVNYNSLLGVTSNPNKTTANKVPKIEKVTIKETKYNRASVIGRNASTISELQQIVSDYIGVSPKEDVDWIKFYVNDNTRGGYYIELNKGKKNTVKNVNPETLNSINFKRVIDAKDYLVKNYDWTDFFELGSQTSASTDNYVKKIQVTYESKKKYPPIGSSTKINTLELYGFLRGLSNGNYENINIQPIGKNNYGYGFSPLYIKTQIWVNILLSFPQEMALKEINRILYELYPQLNFDDFVKNSSTSNQNQYPEYYEYIGDSSYSFSKGKIYKIRNPKDIEAKENFIDNDGTENGFSGENYKKFKPSTEEAFLAQQGGVSSVSSIEPKSVDAVNVEFVYPDGRIEVSATINISNLKNALSNFWNIVNKTSWLVRITPFENQVTPFEENKLIIGSDYGEFNPETLSEEQLGEELKSLYPDLDWSYFLKEKTPTSTNASTSVQPFDFTDTKIDVEDNPELSLKVQRRAFENGWEWENGGGKTFDYNDYNYLYFTKTSISFGNTTSSFVRSPKRRITEADIFGSQSTASQTPTSSQVPTTDAEVFEISVGYKNDSTGNSGAKRKYSIKELYDFLKLLYEYDDKFSSVSILPYGKNFYNADVKVINIYDNFWENILEYRTEENGKEEIYEFLQRNYPDLNFEDFAGLKKMSSTVVQNVRIEPYDAYRIVLNWKDKSGKDVVDTMDIFSGASGKFFIEKLNEIEAQSQGKDVEVRITVFGDDDKGNQFDRNDYFTIGENWFKPSTRTNEQIKSVTEDWIDGVNFDKYFADVIPLGGSQAPTSNKEKVMFLTAQNGSTQRDVINLGELSDFISDFLADNSGVDFSNGTKLRINLYLNGDNSSAPYVISLGENVSCNTCLDVLTDGVQRIKEIILSYAGTEEFDWSDFFEETFAIEYKPIDLSQTKIWFGKDVVLSKKIQERAFELGWSWKTFTSPTSSNYVNEPALYFSSDKDITYGDDRRLFDSNKEFKEITLKDLFEKLSVTSNVQTPTLSGSLGTVKEISDFKEVIGVLEGIASQVSKKYNTENYEESLKLLNEVKDDYSTALSLTPESAFMYERIEMTKKITEIQKEIKRITELKNGGAFYILSKVIERLEKGENWKELGIGEIMVNEVPEQEIDTVIYTEKFKNWFGDWEKALVTKEYDYVSKALTESGKPCVMYHGAKRIKYSYRQVSNGVLYLAENKSYAEWFSANNSPYQKQGDYLTQCFVDLKNPIDLTPFGVDEVDLRDVIQYIDALYPLAKIYDVLDSNISLEIMSNNLIGINVRAWNIIRQYPKLNTHIRENTNYDGFIYYENNPSDKIFNEQTGQLEDRITKATAVFNSNQVKLVDAILFDGSLDDWRFEKGGKVNN